MDWSETTCSHSNVYIILCWTSRVLTPVHTLFFIAHQVLSPQSIHYSLLNITCSHSTAYIILYWTSRALTPVHTVFLIEHHVLSPQSIHYSLLNITCSHSIPYIILYWTSRAPTLVHTLFFIEHHVLSLQSIHYSLLNITCRHSSPYIILYWTSRAVTPVHTIFLLNICWCLLSELRLHDVNNHQMTLQWSYRQFVTTVHALFYFLHDIMALKKRWSHIDAVSHTLCLHFDYVTNDYTRHYVTSKLWHEHVTNDINVAIYRFYSPIYSRSFV